MKGDRFGWSPDIGGYVLRDDKYYSEYGRVYEMSIDCMFRTGLDEGDVPVGQENYADWTDEKREQVFAALKKAADVEDEERQAEIDARVATIRQAAKKLTKEEYEAIMDEGMLRGRGYDYWEDENNEEKGWWE